MLREFDFEHLSDQVAIVSDPVVRGMDASVAVWAKTDDVGGVIRAAVADTVKVMGLQVWGAVLTFERCWCTAPFAMPGCARQDVIANAATALVNIPSDCALGGGDQFGIRERTCSQNVEGGSNRSCSPNLFNHGIQVAQLENDSIAFVSVTIERAFDVIGFTDHFPVEAKPFAFAEVDEKQKAFPACRVICYRSIAALHLHVTNLAGAKIFKRAVRPPSISIAVSAARLSGNGDHKWMAGESDDAALPAALTIKSIVNVLATIVDASLFKAPTHVSPPKPEVSVAQECFGNLSARAAA